MKWNEKKRSEMKWNYFMSARCEYLRDVSVSVCVSLSLFLSVSLSHWNIINFCLFKVCALSDCFFLRCCLFSACLLHWASLEFQFQRYKHTKIQRYNTYIFIVASLSALSISIWVINFCQRHKLNICNRILFVLLLLLFLNEFMIAFCLHYVDRERGRGR